MSDYNSSLPIRTENAGDAIVKVADATIPSQQLKVEADGSVNVNASFAPGTEVKITDGTDTVEVNGDGSINVVATATDLDIRDLSHTQDSVAIGDGTDTLAVNADGSLNITDNGGSLTVDATDLDIRDLTSASDSVEVLQATHDNLNANANIQVGDTDVSNGNPVPVSDAGGSLTVDATDLDIRNLSASQDNVAISDGTDTVAVNTDGSINVVVQEDVGTEDITYNITSAVASSATTNHDRVYTNGGKLYQVVSSASAKAKMEVQIETGASTGVFNTINVQFNSTATPNMDMRLAKYKAVPVGARVRVIMTNRDNQSQDLYSTIVGVQD